MSTYEPVVTQQILDLIASKSADQREARKMSKEVVDALKECGFFTMLLPKQWGGLERKPQEFFAEQVRIAEADMSTAWAGGIIAVHAFQLALMSEEAQREVYEADPNTLISSSYNPVGARAEMCEGGFMLHGRWGWSSGSDHCTWALLGGVIPGDGYRTFLVPRNQYDIEDTWDVMGLQGTGSNDVVISEPIFVPDHRTHKQMDGFNCVNDQDNPMYDLSWAQTFVRVVNSAAIGALKKAVKVFVESKQGNSTTDMTKFAGDVETQERLAKVLNTIGELEAVMYHNFDKMEAASWKPTLEDRIMYRYQASIVIDKAIEAIDTLFEVAGGRSVFNGHPLQQLWHDIHIARCHVANNPTAFARNLGSVALGMENKDVFI
ncbi:flavin-dependent monooxygenase [Luminiphilus sp.]|jgi:3-hydroxy-9,10-secoandrosta-1,3,5(10)-triene-9,17-dione monooxygenase|nr:acyl-CoA dehydrogenase family protein [Luminiphilus sp.]MBT5067785.1 flavin-dependent monooxygenase [Halieaceae bacterium]MBT5134408.1 flavin-dependent monooxygenase [Halieaceae bacterium]MBT5555694.1 flavin-dependent monooxygenase [Halieaceae bacterium]MDA8662075.1 flavin-dependent monooxygenase [Luminiphilus sp.]